MASLRPALTLLRGRCHSSAPQWQQLPHMLQSRQISPKARHTRPLSTLPPDNDDSVSKDSFATGVATDSTGMSDEAKAAFIAMMIAKQDKEEVEAREARQSRYIQSDDYGRTTSTATTLPPDNDNSVSKDSFATGVATDSTGSRDETLARMIANLEMEDSTGSRDDARAAILSRMIANLNMEMGDEYDARQSRFNQSSAREDAFPPGITDDYGRTTSTATLTDASQGMARGWDKRGQEDGHQPQWAPRQSRDDQEQMENRKRYAVQAREGAMAEKQSEEDEDQEDEPANRIYARAMPTSPSYFSRQATFNDNYLLLRKLMRKLAHLPTVPPNQQIRVAYRSRKDYKLAVGEDIKASEYAKALDLVKRLYKIHPHLRPAAVQDAIADFLRDINPYNQKLKDIPVDKFGRTLGVGKRKTSTARAWVVEGVGEVLVNGKSLADAFGRVHDRESAVWALKATERTDKYNVWALVEGGGTTGQAEALAMAVGKALMAHEPALKPALRRAGVVTRDPRGVERKKPGHVKARKSPAWVKR